MMNKIGKTFIIIGLFLISVSLVLLIYNKYEEKEAGKKSKEVLNNMKNIVPENTSSTLNEQEINEMLTISIDGYDYIGTLTIPSLDLELPIMSEYDDARLKIAPCRYYGSIYTNDLVLCAHGYKTHFKYLSKLNQKDTIIFTDVSGKNYIYEVSEIEILNRKEISKMIESEFDLTLYTCTNDGINRLTVRCNRVL